MEKRGVEAYQTLPGCAARGAAQQRSPSEVHEAAQHSSPIHRQNQPK
jgi:hypothetical protein